ncbi:MAG: hypothetical protein JXR63_07275 [Spirochaetales bacterium]|nr:hypothetical protein [Spirochaetales bacterium]
MKKRFLILLTVLFFINIYSDDPDEYSVGKASDSFIKKVFDLNSFFTLDQQKVNLTSKNSSELIRLIGYKFSDDSVYFKKIMFVLERSGKEISLYTLPQSIEAGYEPAMEFYDFTGDGVSEVLYKSSTGGSGGFYYYAILSFQKAATEVLLPNRQEIAIKATGKFIKGFKAEYKLPNQETKIIDLSQNKEYYIQQKVYDETGNIVNDTELWITTPVTIEPVKSGEKYNIKTIQMIKGLSNADTIGQINAEWEYKDKEWKLINIE